MNAFVFGIASVAGFAAGVLAEPGTLGIAGLLLLAGSAVGLRRRFDGLARRNEKHVIATGRL